MRRWIALVVTGVVLTAGVGAWRLWPREDLCELPGASGVPNPSLPSGVPRARLDPPKPPRDSLYPLLYNAAHHKADRALGRVRWAIQTTNVDGSLTVRANEKYVLVKLMGQLAAYRLSDGRLLWRLADRRLDGGPDLFGDNVVLDRREITEDGRGMTDVESVTVALDARTGGARWCLRNRKALDERFYQAGSPDGGRVVLDDNGWTTLLDARTGRTVARIRTPRRDEGQSPELRVGWGKLAVRNHGELSVYRLADGRLLYHVPDLPHVAPRKGERVITPEAGRVTIGPGRVLAETKVSGPDGRFLATAYDDAGHVAWQRPSAEHELLPYRPVVFDDALILPGEGSTPYEARRLTDGKRLWRGPLELGDVAVLGNTGLYHVGLTDVTGIHRATGAVARTRLVGGRALDEDAVRGRPDALVVTDLSSVAVFDLPVTEEGK